MMQKTLCTAGMSIVVLGLTLASPTQAARRTVENTTFFGTVIQLGDVAPRTSSTTLRVHVDRLTSDAEAARFTDVLRKRGERTLENELAAGDMGYLQIGTRFPERLSAAFLRDVDGERHLILITQRPFSIREVFRSARSASYRFRVVELTLDAQGNGTGAMLGAARFKLEKDGTLGARNLGIWPWRIMNLRPIAG